MSFSGQASDVLPLYCPQCDKQGISSKMIRVMRSAGEGMRVKCAVANHVYNYETLMKLNPRKEQLVLNEKMPPSCIVQNVWVHPEAWAMLQKRFPQTLMTTLCATITALADPDTVMVEGQYAREMRTLGVERGRDVLGLAKRVKELEEENKRLGIVEQTLAPFLKALGDKAPQGGGEQRATVGGQRNPDLPQVGQHEDLVEDPETGMLVPSSEFVTPQQATRVLPQQPPMVGSVNEARPPFVRRLA